MNMELIWSGKKSEPFFLPYNVRITVLVPFFTICDYHRYFFLGIQNQEETISHYLLGMEIQWNIIE